MVPDLEDVDCAKGAPGDQLREHLVLRVPREQHPASRVFGEHHETRVIFGRIFDRLHRPEHREAHATHLERVAGARLTSL